MAGGVQEEAVAPFRGAIVLIQGTEHGFGIDTVISVGIRGKFQQSRCHNGRGGRVFGCVRNIRVAEIPVRHLVFRQAGQVDIGNLLRELQEAGFPGEAVHHRVSIDAPGLAAGPHRVVGIALMGAAVLVGAALGVEHRHMIGRAVRTEIVPHRRIGVRDRNVLPSRVSPVLSSPEQRFQVEHVVHDGVVPAEIGHFAGPAQDGAHRRIEQGGEALRRGEHRLLIGRIAGQPEPVAEGREHDEADVVVIGRLPGDEVQCFRVAARGGLQRGIAGGLVRIPEDARPEAHRPVLLAHGRQVPAAVSRRDVARRLAVIGTEPFLDAGHLLDAVVQRLVGQGGRPGAGCRQQEAGSKTKRFHHSFHGSSQ